MQLANQSEPGTRCTQAGYPATAATQVRFRWLIFIVSSRMPTGLPHSSLCNGVSFLSYAQARPPAHCFLKPLRFGKWYKVNCTNAEVSKVMVTELTMKRRTLAENCLESSASTQTESHHRDGCHTCCLRFRASSSERRPHALASRSTGFHRNHRERVFWTSSPVLM